VEVFSPGAALEHGMVNRMGEPMVKRILVVDDEERYCDVVSQMLRSKGYECEITNDPFDALRLLHEKHFEMVVSDIRMKGKDGLQLMREALEELPDLDFIIMTGYTSDYDYTHIVEAGASDFISKPFTAGELEAKIGRIERERRVLSSLIETNRYLLREISLNMSIA
jgi:DNA-binding NtrC family response regulator